MLNIFQSNEIGKKYMGEQKGTVNEKRKKYI